MSIRYSSLVWADNTVRNSAKLLLLAIADHANDEGVCWPPVARLAQMAGVTTRQAQRLLTELEAAGKITVQRGSGRGHRSVYMLMYGVKTVTTSAETVTNGAETVTYVPPIAMPERVTLGGTKGDIYAANGDICGVKGDMLPHACGEPSTKPSLQPSERQSSSSPVATPDATQPAGAADEEEDDTVRFEDDEHEYDPVLVALWRDFEAIAGREGLDQEWQALEYASERLGFAGLEQLLARLRNVWDRIRQRDNLANWILSAADRSREGAYVPAHRDSAEVRRKRYQPSW